MERRGKYHGDVLSSLLSSHSCRRFSGSLIMQTAQISRTSPKCSLFRPVVEVSDARDHEGQVLGTALKLESGLHTRTHPPTQFAVNSPLCFSQV